MQMLNRKLSVHSVYYDSTDIFLERGGYVYSKDAENADIIILNGGEDISTSYYNEQPITRMSPQSPSRRDRLEEQAARVGMQTGALLFGICRGAQLLNCLNGGSLWQHVDNHGGSNHPIIDLETGEEVHTTSIHHQMMIPTKDARIIAVASRSTRKARQGEQIELSPTTDLRLGQDPELLWYANTRSLCIQGHPEYGYKPFTDYCFRVLDRLLAEENAAKTSSVAVG